MHAPVLGPLPAQWQVPVSAPPPLAQFEVLESVSPPALWQSLAWELLEYLMAAMPTRAIVREACSGPVARLPRRVALPAAQLRRRVALPAVQLRRRVALPAVQLPRRLALPAARWVRSAWPALHESCVSPFRRASLR
ncbi:MAG TPA: hypothetical protein VNZ02_16045 [Steroidobacteraceae bacterium]|nr:hypothetical protein [Steroidobacteraceae bacterium]